MAVTSVPVPLQSGFRLFLGEILNNLFGFPRVAVTDSITAFAGGGQTGAIQLVAPFSRVTVVGTAADSVKLPKAQPGMKWSVNNGTATSLNVYPAVGEQINAAGANTAQAVAGNKEAVFVCYTAGFWNGPVALA